MQMLLKLLSLIGLYLFPAIEPGEEEAPPEEETHAEESSEEDDASGAVDDAGEEEEAPPVQPRSPSRSERTIIELRERAQRAEDQIRELRETQTRQSQGPTAAQRQWEEEERQLKDPNTDANTRWQIESNRVLRQTQAQTQAALAQAEDARDAAKYEVAAARNPVYDKYRQKVEQLVADERKQGRIVSREQVLTYLVGQDMLKGNFKSTKAPTKPTLSRGQPAGVRSDVTRKGGMTDQQKRAARLENQII